MSYLHQIDPVALQLGPVALHWYGLMYLCGFAAGWWLGRRRVRAGRLPVTQVQYSDLIFYAMLGVVLGGRIGWILFYGFEGVLAHPINALKVWEGGMSFHGGLLGVMSAVWYWSRKHGIHYFDSMDFIAPLVPPGLGFGRLGNWIGGELWGRHTDGAFAVVFPKSLPEPWYSMPAEALQQAHASGALERFARHPSQLYQAVLEGVVMCGVLWWYSSRPRPRYAVSGMFALLYGVFRFGIEFVREPDAQLGFLAFGWLTMGQLLSLPLIALGLVLMALSRRAPTLAPAA